MEVKRPDPRPRKAKRMLKFLASLLVSTGMAYIGFMAIDHHGHDFLIALSLAVFMWLCTMFMMLDNYQDGEMK